MNYPINNSVSGECDVGKRSRGFVGENTMSGWNRKLSLSWYLWPAQSAHPPRTGLSRASAYIWPALPLPVQSCESLLIHKIFFEHARTQKFIMHFFRTLFISFFHFFFQGDYSFPTSNIHIPEVELPGWLTNGNYKVQGVLGSSEKELGCLKISFSLHSSM